jgi:hypothetical protein
MAKEFPGAEDVDARVGDALRPIVDKPGPHYGVDFAGRLFEPIETTFEVAHLMCAISKAEGLSDVHVLFDGGV